MQKKKKRIFAVLLSAILVVALTGCSKLGSIINEIHGSLIGNNYTVYTYDNYGNQTLKTSGKKISITGNKIETVSYDSDGRAVTGYDLSSVITITIDGKEIVKERIEGGANEKAVWRLFINCPFVCINFDFFWLNKVRQLYMDF